MLREPRISVIVPTKQLSAGVRERIASLRRQTYRNFDVYVVTDEPESFSVAGLDIRLLDSGPLFPGDKRLQAAQASNADLIALIDDDAYAAPGWLECAARHFSDSSVVAAGGPGLTPPDDGASQRTSGAIFASPLVSAAQSRRYVPRAPCDVDFQPAYNLLIRRDSFVTAAERGRAYWPGEDAVLCMLLKRDGRIVYDPDAVVYHHRRPLFWGHFGQVWRYAVQRGHFIPRFPAMSRDPSYLVPLLFLAAHGALAAAVAGPPAVRRTALGIAGTYAALVGCEALRAQRTYAIDPVRTALGIYLTHLTYGAGVACGLAGFTVYAPPVRPR